MQHGKAMATLLTAISATASLTLLAGCGESSQAAEAPRANKATLTVVNSTGQNLSGVAGKAGGTSISFGDVAKGDSERVTLAEGESPSDVTLTWRDARGERHYSTLGVAVPNPSALSITIDSSQKARLSAR